MSKGAPRKATSYSPTRGTSSRNGHLRKVLIPDQWGSSPRWKQLISSRSSIEAAASRPSSSPLAASARPLLVAEPGLGVLGLPPPQVGEVGDGALVAAQSRGVVLVERQLRFLLGWWFVRRLPGCQAPYSFFASFPAYSMTSEGSR